MDFCIWDAIGKKRVTRNWNYAARLGHVDQALHFDQDQYCRLHRLNKLAGKEVGRYLPWWGA